MSTATFSQPILSAAGFDSSIAVNTHVGYSWGSYNDLALVIDDLKYLGVTTLRDGLDGSTISATTANVFNGLASAGYKFDLVVPSGVPAMGAAGLQQYLAALDAFQTSHPGSIIAVEGLNEVNIQAFSYNGSSSLAAAAQFQTAFYSAVKGDSSLASAAVYNLSLGYNNASDYALTGDLSHSTDFANVHAYASTSLTPANAIAAYLATASTGFAGKPFVITETGYSTQEHAPYVGINEDAEARSILNTLVDAYKSGVSETYLYELLDRDSSVGNTDPEAHFGLFHSDGTPKLAATAIHNLTTILADNGSGGHQPAGSLSYSLDNMPVSGSSMVLGKSDGAYDLVVWAEPRVWNDATDTEIVNPSQTVTVHLGSVHGSVKVYDPLSGTAPIAIYSNVQDIQIAISDHPLVIEIDGNDSVTPPVTGPVNVVGSAADIVAQLSALNSSDVLQTITLTDSHTLPIASEATMSYVISHYGNALAAIQGGYQFSVTTSGGNWSLAKIFDTGGVLLSTINTVYSNGVILSKQTVNADGSTDAVQYTNGVATSENVVKANGFRETISYDTTGHMTVDAIQNTDGSASTTVYSNGIMTNAYITNADRSFDAYAYNLVGLSYTTQLQHTDASGKLTEIVRTHADGTFDYKWSLASDGSKLTDVYDGLGRKTTEVLQTSSLTTTDQFDTSGRLTTEDIRKSDGSLVSDAFYTFNADGTKATKIYDGHGLLVTNTILSKDGTTLTTFDTTGTKIKTDVTNSNGTHDVWTYNISGQSYVTEFQHLDANGRVTLVTHTHADGSLDSTINYAADGSKIVSFYDALSHAVTTTDVYNAAGEMTQDIARAPNGDVTTTTYLHGVKTALFLTHADGSKDIQQFDNLGHTTSDVIQNVDGTSSTTLFTNGVESRQYLVSADHSQDIFTYHITGQDYTTEQLHADTSGRIDSVIRTHDDGSLAYVQTISPDGSKVTDLYDASGFRFQETTRDGAGDQDVFTFSPTANGAAAGSLAQQSTVVATADPTLHESYDATDHLRLLDVRNLDGSHQVTAFATGLTISGGNGNDVFNSAGSTNIVFDHGSDIINGFHAGSASNHDTIQILHSLASEYSQLQIEQSGADSLIHISATDSILLKNVSAGGLDHGNFLFV